MKLDVLQALMAAWKDKTQSEVTVSNADDPLPTFPPLIKVNANLKFQVWAYTRVHKMTEFINLHLFLSQSGAEATCCTDELYRESIEVSRNLVWTLTSFISGLTCNFKEGQLMFTYNELLIGILSTKLLQVMSSASAVFQELLDLEMLVIHLQMLVVSLDEKLTDLSVSSDEKGNIQVNSKRSQSRERIRAVRRAASAFVSLIQELSLQLSQNAKDQGGRLTDGAFEKVMNVHCLLLEYLHKSRIIAAHNSESNHKLLNMKSDSRDSVGSFGRSKEVNNSVHRIAI